MTPECVDFLLTLNSSAAEKMFPIRCVDWFRLGRMERDETGVEEMSFTSV